MGRKHAGLLQSLGALQCDLKWPDTKTSAAFERKGLHHPNCADSCPRTHCLPVPSKLVNFLQDRDIIFFFSPPLSECSLAGFSGAAPHLWSLLYTYICFLFWRSKLNLLTIDLHIPPPLHLKILVYSSANRQADHSNKSNKSYQLTPKCTLLQAVSENTLPWAWSSQASVWPSRCVPRP